MSEPVYTYTAASPCFKITHDKPIVLKGCSCGWPATSCAKVHGTTEQLRKMAYSATVMWASPDGDNDAAR